VWESKCTLLLPLLLLPLLLPLLLLLLLLLLPLPLPLLLLLLLCVSPVAHVHRAQPGSPRPRTGSSGCASSPHPQ
jgi:hypothetical protein